MRKERFEGVKRIFEREQGLGASITSSEREDMSRYS